MKRIKQVAFILASMVIAITAGYFINPHQIVRAVTSGWAIAGDNVYFTDGNVGIGTSSPSNLFQVVGKDTSVTLKSEVYDGDGEFSKLDRVSDVYVQGDYAYVTSSWFDNGFTIMDISDPTDPVKKSEVYHNDGEFSKLYDASHVVVQGDYAYVAASQSNAITIMDISDPTNPNLKSEIYDGDGEFTTLQTIGGLAIEGDYLYVSGSNDKAVTIIDVSDPTDPDYVDDITEAFENNPTGLFVKDDYLYVAKSDEVHIYDVSTKTNPQLASKIQNGGTYPKLSGAHEVFVQNDLLYITSMTGDSMYIVDVSTKTSPVKKSEIYDGDGTFSKLDGLYGVYVEGDYAYVASRAEDALTIIDVSDSTSPSLVAELYDGDGTYSRLDYAQNVHYSNGHVFVVSPNDDSLTIIGHNVDKEAFSVTKDGDIGVNQSTPKATLDINGFMKLKKQSSAPATCGADTDGAISLTSGYRTCVCKSGTGWVYTSDGSTSCSW